MLNGIRIVELFKQPLSIAYRGKEKNILLARTKRISIIQKVKKKQKPIELKGASNRALNS